MSSLVDTLEQAGLVMSGAAICYVLLKWRKHRANQVEASHAQGLIEKARLESETILRDARLSASQEALKAHEQLEQALTARRAERLELERRLAEREGLINSQLQRIVEGEKNLGQQKAGLDEQIAKLRALEEEVAKLHAQTREELQRVAGLFDLARHGLHPGHAPRRRRRPP